MLLEMLGYQDTSLRNGHQMSCRIPVCLLGGDITWALTPRNSIILQFFLSSHV